MKASELIHEIQDKQAIYGDLPVKFFQVKQYGLSEIDKVAVFFEDEERTIPACIAVAIKGTL